MVRHRRHARDLRPAGRRGAPPRKPDLVLSGINKGENLGTVTFYSATVGAAREAAFLGIPAMAVNLASAGRAWTMGRPRRSRPQSSDRSDRAGSREGHSSTSTFPPFPPERLRGVRITRQDTRAPIDFFEKPFAPDGSTAYKPPWSIRAGRRGTRISGPCARAMSPYRSSASTSRPPSPRPLSSASGASNPSHFRFSGIDFTEVR